MENPCSYVYHISNFPAEVEINGNWNVTCIFRNKFRICIHSLATFKPVDSYR
jgi:hypothetical protein